MSLTRTLFSFRGRIPRSVYCLVFLSVNAASFLIWLFLDYISTTGQAGYIAAWILSILWLLSFLWISLAVEFKRWHDIGHSGWMFLIGLILIWGNLTRLACCALMKGDKGSNRYGEDPLPPTETKPQKGVRYVPRVNLPVEMFLCLRHLKPRGFASVITLISLEGVTLGVAVLIVIIAVMSGFDRDLRAKILEMNAHLVVTNGGIMDHSDKVMKTMLAVPGVKAASPYVWGPVLIEFDRKAFTPYVKGVDPMRDRDVTALERFIRVGKYDLDGQSVIVGTEMARQFGMRPGDKITVYSPRNFQQKKEVYLPMELTVTGIFDSGLYEFDLGIIFTSVTVAQELYNLGSGVHEIAAMVEDGDDPKRCQAVAKLLASPQFFPGEFTGRFTTHGLLEALTADGILLPKATTEVDSLNKLIGGSSLHRRFEKVHLSQKAQYLAGRGSKLTKNERMELNRLTLEAAYPLKCPVNEFLNAQLRAPLRVETWMQRNKKVLMAVQVEKNVMFFILVFIIIVAAFGICSTLITTTIQKTREIGILKAVGASPSSVMAIFVLQGLVVGVFGTLLGFGAGMLLLHYRNPFNHWLSATLGYELFPREIYNFSEIPAQINAPDVAWICATALVICTVAGIIPALRAARLDPVEALRYE